MPTDKSIKAPDAFRTISEVAGELDLPQHILRFWETKFSKVRPMKRGGGRRYYRPEDIALLRYIQHLLYDEGYTIKGVQKLMRDRVLNKTTFKDNKIEVKTIENTALKAEIKDIIEELEALRIDLISTP
jgi:DNA-binding transcriptional MerR regulator